MPVSRTASFAIGAVTALVLGSGTAYAATGGNFILGKGNAASRTTSLSNPNGTALTLNSKAGTPPLRVNRIAKVPRLNADLLDDKHASAFALAAGRTGAFDFEAFGIDTDESGGNDLFLANAACPPNTKRTGGGGFDGTATGFVIYNGPDGGNSWTFAVFVDETSGDLPEDVVGSIVCYNPRGGFGAGSYRSEDGTAATGGARTVEPSAELMAKIEKAAAAKSAR
jgi:hypothetical protein